MTLQFGVAGTGHWASEVHLAGLLRTDGAEVVGLWGRTPSRVEEIAKRHQIRPFARLSDMLAEVDAVSIAVQPGLSAILPWQLHKPASILFWRSRSP